MDRRRHAAERLELVWVRGGDGGRFEGAEAAVDLVPAAERVLHAVLLVEHHPDQQGERVLVEDAVGVRVVRDVEGHEGIVPRRASGRQSEGPDRDRLGDRPLPVAHNPCSLSSALRE